MIPDQELLRQIDEQKSGAENKRSIAQLVHQRERGMWSFLTWSFFLSQLVGSGLLSTGAAKAAETPELASGSDETGVGNAAGSLSNEADEVATTDESTEAPTTTIVSGQSGETGSLQAKVAGVAAPEGGVTEGQHGEAETAAAASGSGESASSEDGECGCPSSNHNPPNNGHDCHGQDQNDVAPVVVDNGASPVLPGLGPIIDVVGDAVETAGNTVIDPVVDLVDNVTEAVGGLVETVADNVLSPVTETVGDLLSSVTDGVLTPILDPVGDLVEAVADNVVSPVTQTVGLLLSSATEGVLSPLLDPVDQLVETLADDVLSPVTETAGDLLLSIADAAAPAVESVTDAASLLANDIASPALAPAVNLVAQVADDVLSPMAEPVLNLVSSVADDIISPVADPLFETVSKVTDPIIDAASPILEPVEGLVQTVAEPLDPIIEAASPILTPVTDIVAFTPLGGLLPGLFGGSGTSESSVASGGTIEFAQSSTDTGNVLYQDGSYTQYGLAMQTDDEADTGSAASSGSQETDQIALIDIADSDGMDAGGPLGVSKLLSDIGLHGDGLGLWPSA